MLIAPLHEKEIRKALGLLPTGELVVDGIAPLDAAKDNCLYFISKTITTEIRMVLAALSGCIVIAPNGFTLAESVGANIVIETPDPRAGIAKVLKFIHDEKRLQPWVKERKISPSAVVSPLAFIEENVEIGEGARVDPFCTVGSDVIIGRGSILCSGARIHSRVKIGDHTIISDNSVIGTAGYGFIRDEDGNKKHIPHLGGVLIGSYVEVGVLSVIQCGTISPTLINDHAKVGDLVLVGHNAHIARGVSITGAVIVGGSAIIGEDAWIGVNSSIRNGRRVGPRALVGMDASVQADLAENGIARAPRPNIETRSIDDNFTSIGFVDR